ncbi:MAG: dTDP-glucose 4,6-dehydratase [Spirochaetaceae bacterium]|nr:dTDP-glucose 4,6-dehydratase [Treponema sp.]MBP3451042.1 dTDP-glucose 4,6-dehydratase [Spirochaetaceae bacterium]
MTRKLTNILVTGGAGFIGCNFIHFMFSDESGFSGKIINVDCLTYAGNAESLKDVDEKYGELAVKNGLISKENQRYFFEKVDICDGPAIDAILKKYHIDTIVHFAAESHVDRSILGPEAFVKTNVMGTFNLLDLAKNYWKNEDGTIRNDVLFHHISTDEVYGSLGDTGYFTETTPYDPRSPYSSSKASSDHLVMAYYHTYGLPITLSNCTNNYGPYQFPEKLLPLMINNIKTGKKLPVYGDGLNIRDWVYVEDHNRAVWLIIKNGKTGEKYNIGGENEWTNIKLLKEIIKLEANELGLSKNDVEKTITFVKDRPGHDRRYAIDCTKIKKELGWQRKVTFEEGLLHTIKWYLKNTDWIDNILSGEYRNWIENNYDKR